MAWWVQGMVVALVVKGAVVMVLLGRTKKDILRAVMPFAVIYVILIPSIYFAAWASRALPSSSWWTALFSLTLAVLTCALLGFTIERLAYRPLRDKPRINSLIT